MDLGFFVIVALAALIAASLAGSAKNNKIGRVKCNRCGYVGKPKNKMVPFHGAVPVCRNCSSDQWTKV